MEGKRYIDCIEERNSYFPLLITDIVIFRPENDKKKGRKINYSHFTCFKMNKSYLCSFGGKADKESPHSQTTDNNIMHMPLVKNLISNLSIETYGVGTQTSKWVGSFGHKIQIKKTVSATLIGLDQKCFVLLLPNARFWAGGNIPR